MVLFNMYGVFLWRFLESRKYKIQIVAHVERKSVVELSGIMEASYSHFFIGIDFNCVDDRNLARQKNGGRKPPSAPESTTADFLPTWATIWILYFLDSRNLEKKTPYMLNNTMEDYRNIVINY